MPTFGSLFAGIGGIDLGLERAGWNCVWQVEIDEFCQRVLAKHWPGVTRYGDIRDVDWSGVEPVDLVCGGFPCQPVSQSGKKAAQDDSRWLWPEFARCVRDLRPRYVLLENVAGLIDRGMGEVLGDLAAMGLDAEWGCIPASAFGAPHLRERLFLVAHDHRERIEGIWSGTVPRFREFEGWADVRRIEDIRERSDLPEPLIRRMGNGISRRLDTLGNAVLPQAAEWIGQGLLGVCR